MEKRKVNGKAILKDIKAGLSASDLKKKYNLLDSQLQKVFEKLSGAGLLTTRQIQAKPKIVPPPKEAQMAERPICEPGERTSTFADNHQETDGKSAKATCRISDEAILASVRDEIADSANVSTEKSPAFPGQFSVVVMQIVRKYKAAVWISGIALLCILIGFFKPVIWTLALAVAPLIVVFALVMRLYRKRVQPEMSDSSPLPEHFLQLDASLRRRALDLAWEQGWQKAIKKMVQGRNGTSPDVVYFVGYAAIAAGVILNLYLLGMLMAPDYKPAPSSKSMADKSSEQTTSRPVDKENADIVDQIRAETREQRLSLYRTGEAGFPLETALGKVMPGVRADVRLQVFENWQRMGLWPPRLEELAGDPAKEPQRPPTEGSNNNSQVRANPESDDQRGLLAVTVTIILGVYGTGLACLSAAPRLRRRDLELEAKRRDLVAMETRLRDLARQFVSENYDYWIQSMSHISLYQAKKSTGTAPNAAFRLVSQDLAVKLSGMPRKAFDVTYILSNGYISVVSGIKWDMYNTINSLIERDDPLYCIVPEPPEWNFEEFHYQDVVEVTYRPRPEKHASMVSGDRGTIKKKLRLAKELEPEHSDTDPVQGYLVLSLVNGEKKEYPTVKDAATSFLSVAREKVRESKRR